jgi:hypothetical protein
MTTEQLPSKAPWQRDPINVPLTTVLVGVGAAIGLRSLSDMPDIERRTVALMHKNGSFQALGAILLASVVGCIAWQRVFADELKPRERGLHAAAYGAGATLAALLLLLPQHGYIVHAFIHDTVPLCLMGLTFSLSAAAGYLGAFGSLRPIVKRKRLTPYPLQIEKQRRSYDYTIGAYHPEDEKGGGQGKPEWIVWPELGAFCNMIVFGSIGSGKTSQVCDPLVQQAMGKFPDAPDKQVSMFILDYKGNQAERYYQWAKQFNRHERFFVLRPDIVCARDGTPLIPESQYVSFSPLQGHGDSDLTAIELQEALESTKEQRSPDYFQMVQTEFLKHALRLLTAGNARADLADLHSFASSDEVRKAVLNRNSEGDKRVQESAHYFQEAFGKLSAQDQAGLLRGLASQLSLLANEAMQRAFCTGRQGNSRQALGSWSEELLAQPTIIVFSCPPSQYTKDLSRILGMLMLKSFQTAMSERSNKSFMGNTQRPVMLVADEAHAYLNKGLGDFLAVSRESRVTALLLTQALSQLGPVYRDMLMASCRSQITLEIDEGTAQHFEKSLGRVNEVQESVSFSESQRTSEPQSNRPGSAVDGGSAGTSKSYSVRSCPRFATSALRHMKPFSGVAHLFDGERQLPSCTFSTTSWYRLPYYLLDVRDHANLICSPGILHQYEAAPEGAMQCKTCKKTLATPWEIQDYKDVLRVIPRLTSPRRSAVPSGEAS